MPPPRHIPEVAAITPRSKRWRASRVSGLGRGGMTSKLIAAKIATGAGCDVIIAKGESLHPRRRDRQRRAPHAVPRQPHARRRAQALDRGRAASREGVLMIDEGAVRALGEGKSLLPAGIRQVDGRFERGDAVLVKDREGREIARGLAAYNASDAERIAGKRTVEIEAILGYRGRDEMIHRDDLVLTGQ